MLHDVDIAERQLLVQRRSGTVVAYDLQKKSDKIHLPIDQPLRLNQRYQLIRAVEHHHHTVADGHPETEVLVAAKECLPTLALMIGRSNEARRIPIKDQPLHIGADLGNDVVLYDRAVSRIHCRLEPTPCALRVKDLGSKNGTFINGVRVLHAELVPGSWLRVGNTDLQVQSRRAGMEHGLVAASAEMQHVMGEVARFAALSWPVLICGPSGVGKEAVTRALHSQSARSQRALVAINAGGLPRNLLESELFGHERGAFTGASEMHRGAFERAQGGTLFLDEIGELPLDAQTRLLRVVEAGEVQRVGAESVIPLDVRLVCATHRDLGRMVSEGTFREDLYYRLARLVIAIPPLNVRPLDIEPLSAHFLVSMQDEIGPRTLSREALDQLTAHGWPGNVRELRNVLALAAVSTGSTVIHRTAIAHAVERLHGVVPALASQQGLHDIVARYRGNLSAAARSLGIPRSTLRDRLGMRAQPK